ncbi:MAG: 7-cyano-7-deazaguanine synthase, partial [Leptospiraceae bacterium]|nr:7-cyano-7-deazaguanine synthase [Leptospiraceae bacterium]
MKNKFLIILSGGLDSTVCAYLAKNESKYMEAITFDYNQRHKIELKKAKKIAKLLKINHTIIKIPTGIFQNSSLVDKNISVKKNKISTK